MGVLPLCPGFLGAAPPSVSPFTAVRRAPTQAEKDAYVEWIRGLYANPTMEVDTSNVWYGWIFAITYNGSPFIGPSVDIEGVGGGTFTANQDIQYWDANPGVHTADSYKFANFTYNGVAYRIPITDLVA
mgnify:CR=1 FL=1